MQKLLAYLNSIYPLSSDLVQYLAINLKTKDFRKKDFLLKKGRVSKEIHFIESGLFRCFYMLDDKKVSSWFMKEGDVIISVESFFNQTESYESIQAIEDSTVNYLTYEELQFIYNNFPEFNYVGRVVTERYYTLSEQRLFSLRMHRSHEKYEFFKKHHPDLVDRIPSRYLASYLGISEVTLSNIKNNF